MAWKDTASECEYNALGASLKKKKLFSEIRGVASCSMDQHFHIYATESTDNE